MKTRTLLILFFLPIVGVILLVGYSILESSGALGFHHIADFEEPTPVRRLEVHDGAGTVLWRIDAQQPVVVSSVDYGVLPKGFRQVTPPHGQPRPLTPDEPLLLAYTSDTWWCRHRGKAVGIAAFMGGGYFRGQLSNTPVDDVFSVIGPAR